MDVVRIRVRRGDSRTSNLWSGRPWMSRLLRAGIVAGPVAASFATAAALSSFVMVPATFAVAVARWVTIAVTATVVLAVTDRLARRLSPLVALLDLTLTFPDRAPSRFRLALRNGSTRQLRLRVDDARRGLIGDTPQKAAERVLELVAALNVHDRITHGHSERVRAYSRTIGEELGLNERELDRLQWAGLLHDVGKLLVPAAILNKAGPLTDSELAIVREHPEHGRNLVTPLTGWLGESSRAVWEHHERWDGRGYPAGLAGTEISLAARIVSVADAFDVMTSARSYKQPISSADARAELARSAGTHFDPTVVRAFLNLSIPRLRRVTGPLSWLAQASLFPTSVFSSAAGGGLVTAATLVAAGTFGAGAGAVEDTAARAPTTEHGVDIGPGAAPSPTTESVRPEPMHADTTDLPTTTSDPRPTPTATTTHAPATTVPVVPPVATVPTVLTTTTKPTVTLPEPTSPPLTPTAPTVTLPPLTSPTPPPPIVSLPPLTVPTLPPSIVTLVPVALPPVTLPPPTLPLLSIPPLTLPPVTLPPLPLPFWILP